MSDTGSRYGVERTSETPGEVRILLADDDKTWADSTAEILERQRDAFSVRTANTLSAASSALADEEFDCVVCDYQLRNGTGFELLSDVREQSEDKPFILITGQGSESVASEAIGQQVTDYMPKRILGSRDDPLARRIETAVESYRTRQELATERRSKEAMLDILTETSSREGLAQEFCDHLVREHDYDCVWIGTVSQSRSIVPRAAAGVESYLDETIEPGTLPEEGTEPALVALANNETHVVTSVAETATVDDWQRTAVDYDFGSALGIPIDHDGTLFGVLAVYKTAPVVDATETDLLEEYAESIGYALRSVGWKESLLSTSPVAIEIELTDEQEPLVALDRQLSSEARLDVLTSVLREESMLYVLRVTGTTATAVADSTAGLDVVESVDVIQAEAPHQCELVVSLPTAIGTLADHGGRIVEATAERGRVTITAVSPDEDVQPLTSALQSHYPDAGIRSIRSTDWTDDQLTADTICQSLTKKQRNALELAYYNGYFERPREHDTTEVAEKLGVSRQTLTQHLRAGERKLLSGLFDPDE